MLWECSGDASRPKDRNLKFERAIYSTQQKQDESNDSYIARHEACFEDLLQKDHEVSLKEIQSHVLVRHSSLSSEEKKRIIVDSNGILKYETTREAIRLLGSRFFQDLQGTSRGKLKTYDVHAVEEDIDTSSDPHNAKGNGIFVNEEIDEESVFASLMQQGDEDAIFVSEFEDQIIEAVQESEELSSCFTAYQEARSRLRERARHRGFWPATKGKGFGKKGSSKGNQFAPPGRRTLAERIANSTCRLCGKPGHWKRECPERAARGNEMVSMAEDNLAELPEELTATLPDELQDDVRTTCLIRFDRRTRVFKNDWNLMHDCTTCLPKNHPGLVGECFMVSDGGRVKGLMKHALQSARRMSWPDHDASATTRQAKGQEKTAFPPMASFPEFETVHFAEEEGSDELGQVGPS